MIFLFLCHVIITLLAFRTCQCNFYSWPDKETLVKESTAVIVISLVLGVVIALLDMVIRAGIDVII